MSEIRQAWALITLNQWDWQGTVQTCPRFRDSLAHLADEVRSMGKKLVTNLEEGCKATARFHHKLVGSSIWPKFDSGVNSVLFLKGCCRPGGGKAHASGH